MAENLYIGLVFRENEPVNKSKLVAGTYIGKITYDGYHHLHVFLLFHQSNLI